MKFANRGRIGFAQQERVLLFPRGHEEAGAVRVTDAAGVRQLKFIPRFFVGTLSLGEMLADKIKQIRRVVDSWTFSRKGRHRISIDKGQVFCVMLQILKNLTENPVLE